GLPHRHRPRAGSGAQGAKFPASSSSMTERRGRLVVCVDNRGYAASLEKRKIYVALRDAAAEKHRLVRIVDESGEDSFSPKAFSRPTVLPQSVKKAALAAA